MRPGTASTVPSEPLRQAVAALARATGEPGLNLDPEFSSSTRRTRVSTTIICGVMKQRGGMQLAVGVTALRSLCTESLQLARVNTTRIGIGAALFCIATAAVDQRPLSALRDAMTPAAALVSATRPVDAVGRGGKSFVMDVPLLQDAFMAMSHKLHEASMAPLRPAQRAPIVRRRLAARTGGALRRGRRLEPILVELCDGSIFVGSVARSFEGGDVVGKGVSVIRSSTTAMTVS